MVVNGCLFQDVKGAQLEKSGIAAKVIVEVKTEHRGSPLPHEHCGFE